MYASAETTVDENLMPEVRSLSSSSSSQRGCFFEAGAQCSAVQYSTVRFSAH